MGRTWAEVVVGRAGGEGDGQGEGRAGGQRWWWWKKRVGGCSRWALAEMVDVEGVAK